MLRILYNFFIISLESGIRIASLWNPKARLWVNGRKGWVKQIKEKVDTWGAVSSPIIWMHCASLGEFEQGRPLLEQLRTANPHIRVVISFFSPSGYEIRKNYTGADLVVYLPADRPGNVRKFLDLVSPTLVLWIRYEFWHNYLREIKKRNISLLLVSALFRENHIFFRSFGGFWRDTLKCFTHVFVQNEDAADLLKEIGFERNVTVSGDTRFDRVSEIAGAFQPVTGIETFCRGRQVLVAGSTWREDEEEFVHYVRVNKQTAFIIAPHEVDTENIHDIQKLFPGSVKYSEFRNNLEATEAHVLVIDNIGMLSRLYHYADITYVGGGFGDDGLHNILEAAVYDKPVLFGPVHQKHYEAVEMIEAGGAFGVKNALELEAALNRLFANREELQAAGNAAGQYVRVNKGATEKIMDYIERNRLCTS